MCDLLPRETADYQEVLKWVKRQPWCNGNVGTGGISYDGIAGTILASGGGVKAVASVFAPQDIYKDLVRLASHKRASLMGDVFLGCVCVHVCVLPQVAAGGVLAAGFVDTYGKFTMAGERNQPVRGVQVWRGSTDHVRALASHLPCRVLCAPQTPALYRLLTKHFLDGVLPVDATTNDLANAIAEHHGNWDMARQLRRVHYRDDPLVAVPSNQVDAATAPPGSVLAPEDVEGDWDLGTGMDADGGYSVLTVGFFGLNTPPIIEGLTRHKVVVHSWTGCVRRGAGGSGGVESVCGLRLTSCHALVPLWCWQVLRLVPDRLNVAPPCTAATGVQSHHHGPMVSRWAPQLLAALSRAWPRVRYLRGHRAVLRSGAYRRYWWL